ncbi:MAG: sulfite exporter TauE/SafE family protein [Deinococcales bacterium]
MNPLGLVLGALIGIALGLMGGGGSILTVPIFVYVLGIEAKSAIAMSLAVVGATSLFGVLGHWRAGNINVRIAAIFAPIAMLGTFAGAKLAAFLSGQVQLMLFALVMLAAAFLMLRKESPDARATHGGQMPIVLIVLEGLGVGILTGIVGVGGGFLIVPALVLLGKVPMKQAVGTSLVVIALKSFAGFAGYLGQVPVDWSLMATFIAVAGVGIVLGTQLVKLFSQNQLKRTFAVFLLAMGGFVFYQNRAVFGFGTALKLEHAHSSDTQLAKIRPTNHR